MSDSQSNKSFPSMSSSSEETCSGSSSTGLTGRAEQNNNKVVATNSNSSGGSPRPVSGGKLVSNRSSLSSLASMSSTSLGGTSNTLQPQSLNQALARVNNKWDREQRKQDQEATRKLTLLKQRKISAVLKVENLHKTLKNVTSTSSSESPAAIQTKLQQVRELEEEVAAVDRELGMLGEEREQNNRKINLKRVEHVTTLQQLGLLEALALSDCETSSRSTNRWHSEADLKEGGRKTNYQPNSITEENLLVSGRKISPPVATVLSDASRIRSGSDPSLAMNNSEPGRNEPIVRFFRSQDENRKPSTESMGSLGSSRNSRWGGNRTPDSSPKSGRRNPLRMLSNAMDFRSRKRGPHRPKSADFERVSENPAGDGASGRSGIEPKYDAASNGSSSRLLTPPLNFAYTLSNSRYSLPNLDPNDMEEAMNIVRTSPFLTNPRKGSRHPPPLHPLENRNSAPEIVVTSTGSPQAGGMYYQQHAPTSAATSTSSRRLHHGGLEERIQRAKAKVQNGLLHMGSGSSISSSSSSSLSAFTVPSPSGVPTGTVPVTNGFPANGSGGRAKLSTRFQTAQKLNYKLAALSSFSSSIHVKRSRTFNVSDVQDQLAAMGGGNINNNLNNHNSKTLPKQLRNSKLKSSSRDSSELIPLSSGLYRQSSPSSISVGTISGTSSTASSRKSSNSSSNGAGCDPNLRTQINQEALDEIAAFEEFMTKFLVAHSDDGSGTLTNPNQTHQNTNSGLMSAKKKKNALRRIAAVNGDPKVQTLQRQRQLSSQESDEITPT